MGVKYINIKCFYEPPSTWVLYTGNLSKDNLYPSKLGLIKFLSGFKSMDVAILVSSTLKLWDEIDFGENDS